VPTLALVRPVAVVLKVAPADSKDRRLQACVAYKGYIDKWQEGGATGRGWWKRFETKEETAPCLQTQHSREVVGFVLKGSKAAGPLLKKCVSILPFASTRVPMPLSANRSSPSSRTSRLIISPYPAGLPVDTCGGGGPLLLFLLW